ncbi:hypothetical protein A3Q56_03241 [Intoshia linei]|uniref:Homeobox domain-containing protein n=1 Tax=Intoshia linei TaxID=1819745 RepID=A0A177B6J0_9BILA|nr:hypothetical protein A3Q56_03241 [Intoshia linei]
MLNFNVSSILKDDVKSSDKDTSKVTTPVMSDKIVMFNICIWNLNERFLREFKKEKLNDGNFNDWSKNYFERLADLKKQTMPITRRRTAFTEQQIMILEKKFLIEQYPSIYTRQDLNAQLSLPIPTIQIWFKNRRAKERKMHPEQESKNSSSIEDEILVV